MMTFPIKAKKIWATEETPNTFVMFRKSCQVGGFEKACLRISTGHYYALYVNGEHVTRLFHRYFDFRKQYQEIDISPYLRGESVNIIAILCYGANGNTGLMAELVADDEVLVSTDTTWSYKRCEAYNHKAPGHALLFGIPEQYDARKEEIDWFKPSYDDTDWAFCEEDLSESTWKHFTKSTTCDLTYDPVPAESFMAVQLSRAREGLSYNLTIPQQGTGIFATVITCDKSSAISLYADRQPAVLTLDGRPVTLESDIQLSSGEHLLMLSSLSALEFLAHTTDDIAVSAKPITGTDAEWAVMVIEGNYVKYPWHEKPDDIISQAPEIPRAHAASTAQELAEAFPSEFAAVTSAPNSALFRVTSQEYFLPADGILAPKLRETQAYTETDASVGITNRENLLRPVSENGSPADPVALRGSAPTDYADPVALRGSAPTDYARPVALRGSAPTHPRIVGALPRRATARLRGEEKSEHRSESGRNSEPCIIKGTDGFDVHFILDLGREYIGYVEMALDAAEGTLLDVQCFELIDDTGCFYMGNHNGFAYICREGYQRFTSNYRRGCRYISVTVRNMTAPVELYSLALIHNAAPVERVGQFTCDDALLNKVYEMSRDTAELCMLDTYVDCPGHEQNFWVGDARVTALVNLINFGSYGFNQHCIRMVGQSLSPDYVESNFADNPEFLANKFLSMAAFQAYPPASSLPMWSYLWVMQCYDHWLYGGNMDELSENYGYVKRNMENSLLLTGERGLLDYDGAYNLIEWATNDLTPYGEVTANSIFMAKCYELVSQMADVLGEEEDVQRYAELAQQTKDAINTYCWDEERQAYVDTVRDEVSYQTHLRFCEAQGMDTLSYEDYVSLSRVSEQTNTLALLYDIAPEERAQKILPILTRVKDGNYIFGSPADRSVGAPKDGELIDNIVAIGSPFFLFFTIEALFKTGHADIAIEVMRRDWGDMLEHGTNTCWETFKMKGDHYTRSIAHAWGASPAVYLQSRALGIMPLKPGFEAFTVVPCPSDLRYASGSVATPHGPIHVSWEKNGNGEPKIEVDAPDACTCVSLKSRPA